MLLAARNIPKNFRSFTKLRLSRGSVKAKYAFQTRRIHDSLAGFFDDAEKHIAPDLTNLPPVKFDTYDLAKSVKPMTPPERLEFYKKKLVKVTDEIDPLLDFNDLPIDKKIINKLNKEYKKPTLIQSMSWPICMSGRNLIGMAKTGSGKTLSFTLPMYNFVKANIGRVAPSCPIALVVVPTRELAIQVSSEFNRFADGDICSVPIFGGQAQTAQISKINNLNPQVIIATPGRLLDMTKSGTLDLARIGYVVMDEADRMLGMGFEESMVQIFSFFAENQRQITMWTATWDDKLENLAEKYITSPVMIKIGGSGLVTNSDVTQVVEPLNPRNKNKILFQILNSESNKGKKFLIFCNRMVTVEAVYTHLLDSGINSHHLVKILGKMLQFERENSLNRFKSGTARIMMATDVVSRGIDVKDIDFVINYDLPSNIEGYIHRIGRTGRAGRKGTSISFFSHSDDMGLIKPLISVMRKSGQTVSDKLLRLQHRAK